MTFLSTQLDLSKWQPVTFHAESSKHHDLDAASFRGRVPVVLSFVGVSGPTSDELVKHLDDGFPKFGERRVQLLVVVEEDPAEVAQRLQVSVPLIANHELSEELQADIDAQGRMASVIVGNDGWVLDVVRQVSSEDQTAAILEAVDRLAEQYPERFGVLPTHAGHDYD